MRTVSLLKGAGYGTSTLSVLLLGVVSLKAALESSFLMACLVLGMLTSMLGMYMRWRSHRLEQAEKAGSRHDRTESLPDANSRRTSGPSLLADPADRTLARKAPRGT